MPMFLATVLRLLLIMATIICLFCWFRMFSWFLNRLMAARMSLLRYIPPQ